MIAEIEVKKLVDKLSSDRIFKFFRKNAKNIVYFHHINDDHDTEIKSYSELDSEQLKLPTLEIDGDRFLVVHSNQGLSKTLASDQYQVASILVGQLVELVKGLTGVKGIAVQCNSCYFSIDIDELIEGLTES